MHEASNTGQVRRISHRQNNMLQVSLEDIFGPIGSVSTWQECARALLVFVYGLFLVRIAGRRVFGKWAALDIIVSIVVGSNLSRALTGSAALTGTLAATTLLMVLHWLLAQTAARSRWVSKLVEGGPVELARSGETRSGNIKRSGISPNDLEEALRQSGIEHITGTRLVVLEPSGKITVLKAEPGQ